MFREISVKFCAGVWYLLVIVGHIDWVIFQVHKRSWSTFDFNWNAELSVHYDHLRTWKITQIWLDHVTGSYKKISHSCTKFHGHFTKHPSLIWRMTKQTSHIKQPTHDAPRNGFHRLIIQGQWINFQLGDNSFKTGFPPFWKGCLYCRKGNSFRVASFQKWLGKQDRKQE